MYHIIKLLRFFFQCGKYVHALKMHQQLLASYLSQSSNNLEVKILFRSIRERCLISYENCTYEMILCNKIILMEKVITNSEAVYIYVPKPIYYLLIRVSARHHRITTHSLREVPTV